MNKMWILEFAKIPRTGEQIIDITYFSLKKKFFDNIFKCMLKYSRPDPLRRKKKTFSWPKEQTSDILEELGQVENVSSHPH